VATLIRRRSFRHLGGTRRGDRAAAPEGPARLRQRISSRAFDHDSSTDELLTEVRFPAAAGSGCLSQEFSRAAETSAWSPLLSLWRRYQRQDQRGSRGVRRRGRQPSSTFSRSGACRAETHRLSCGRLSPGAAVGLDRQVTCIAARAPSPLGLCSPSGRLPRPTAAWSRSVSMQVESLSTDPATRPGRTPANLGGLPGDDLALTGTHLGCEHGVWRCVHGHCRRPGGAVLSDARHPGDGSEVMRSRDSRRMGSCTLSKKRFETVTASSAGSYRWVRHDRLALIEEGTGWRPREELRENVGQPVRCTGYQSTSKAHRGDPPHYRNRIVSLSIADILRLVAKVPRSRTGDIDRAWSLRRRRPAAAHAARHVPAAPLAHARITAGSM